MAQSAAETLQRKEYNHVTVQKRKFDQFSTVKRREVETLLANPHLVKAELCKRHFDYFIKQFWSEVDTADLIWNWHLDYLSEQLTIVAKRVAEGIPRKYDLVINIPPGSTKSKLVNVMFPPWCWINWFWMRFISVSYSAGLSLEHAESSRDLIRSDKFQQFFPELQIKRDKDVKSNFRITKQMEDGTTALGGSRYSTSVGGTLTGFHAHIKLVDDPLNPEEAVSKVSLEKANRYLDQTLSTRNVNKAVSTTILIMQRLHQDDPTGHSLAKKNKKVFHICIPGEIMNYKDQVRPPELIDKYVDGLMDPKRMSREVLKDMEADLGQYGYAGQVGQNPTPPGGAMFKVDHFQYIHSMLSKPNIQQSIRYWDKAATDDAGAYTSGVLMHRLISGKFLITDVKRGRWATEERENIIRETAEADGVEVIIWHEQEPGSGGKDSALATTRNLAGFSVRIERPTQNKIARADPFSVQVNNGNVILLTAEWNKDYVEEFRYFPYGTFKDQVDSSSGAFNKLAIKKVARVLFGRRR